MIEEFVAKWIFLILIFVLNVSTLSFLRIPILRFIVGLLTPLIAITTELPYDPFFVLIFVILGVMNLVVAGSDVYD